MSDPVSAVRGFVRDVLVDPVAPEPIESGAALRRRRVVSALTLVLGTATLAWSLRIAPGDPLFYAATVLLGVVWAAGALLSGPLHLGHLRTHDAHVSRGVGRAIVLGVAVLTLFVAGALVVVRIPVLREPVQELLDHARVGSLPLVAAITAANGLAEELYFRGALYAAVPRQRVLRTTLAYTAVTAASGILLLVLAGAVLGLVTAMQRRVSGGILGATVTHLMFSLGMLLLLPPLLDALG